MRLFLYEHVTACCEEGGTFPPSLVREGRAMFDAFLTDAHALPALDVRTGPASAFDKLAREADAALLIAPETDGVLEQLARRTLALGCPLLGSTPEAIRLTSNKRTLATWWEQASVRTPTCWPAHAVPADRCCVLKPVDGAGSQDMHLAAPGTVAPTETRLIQEYVRGVAASVSFLIGPHVCLPLLAGEQQLAPDTFEYLGGAFPLTEALAQRTIACASHAVQAVPGLRGFVGVDVVVGERDTWAIEINPRLTTSYIGLRAMTSTNLVDVLLHIAADQPFDPPTWHPHRLRFAPDGTCSME